MKLFNAIGIIAYPPVLDIVITSLFALYSPVGLGRLSAMEAIFISFIFVTMIPFVPFPYYYKKGTIDLNVTEKGKRTKFYLVAVMSYMMGALIFLYFRTAIMFYLLMSFAMIAVVVMVINFEWKISTHAAGIAGPVTAIAYVFGWQFLVLHAFTLVVMCSRLRLKVHTLLQVIGGAALSIIITLLVFLSFMPL
jgi:membrane-associated phospholipid phosphatase